jgi:hypothetical protein
MGKNGLIALRKHSLKEALSRAIPKTNPENAAHPEPDIIIN